MRGEPSGRRVQIWVDIIPVQYSYTWEELADEGTPLSAKALIESFIAQSDTYRVRDLLDDIDLLDDLDFAIRFEVTDEEGGRTRGVLHSSAQWEGTNVEDTSGPNALINKEPASE